MSPPSLGEPSSLISYLPQPLLPSSSSSSSSPSAPPTASALDPIELRVPPATLPLLFAHRQWRAGLLLSDLLSHHPSLVASKRVLELGAGTGLPSIVASRAGAKEVVCTDYDEEGLVARLRENVRNNEAQGQRGRVKVVGHTWGKGIDDLLDLLPDTPQRRQGADVILLADCLWDSLSHASLLKTLVATLSCTPTARIVVVSGLHTGRDVLVQFIRRAEREGLELRKLEAGEGAWPRLMEEEEEEEGDGRDVGEEERTRRECMLELGLAPDSDSPPASSSPSDQQAQVIQAHSPRLSGRRRKWQDQERPEERKEVGGVRERNGWITVWSLGWRE